MAIYQEDNNQHSDGSNTLSYEPQYFDVHIFLSRNNGYSIPVKILSDNVLSEDDVIQHCIDNNLFVEEGDEDYVDYIYDITREEYNKLKS